MVDTNQVCFQVGDFEVTLEIYGGEVVGASAVGPDAKTFDVDFAFRNVDILAGPGCKICRVIHGHYLCEDIECSVLVAAPDPEQT